MCRNHAPRPLYTNLHQERTAGEPHDGLGVGPQVDNRERENGSDHDRTPPPQGLTPGPERPTANDRPNVTNNSNRRNLANTESVLAAQKKAGIDILRAVTEEVEGSHQQDRVNGSTPVLGQHGENLPFAGLFRAPAR